MQGFAVLQGQNYQDQVVEILCGGFCKDANRQKNLLVFLKHQQISSELAYVQRVDSDTRELTRVWEIFSEAARNCWGPRS